MIILITLMFIWYNAVIDRYQVKPFEEKAFFQALLFYGTAYH